MSETHQHDLDGATVGIFLTPRGPAEVEFTAPKRVVSGAGVAECASAADE
ncbi:hypothetical protein [Halobacterium wangiae]|nr:hypothetical protein [Halobacterium wangiae]